MAEHDVGKFMECGLVRELGHAIDRDAALERVSLRRVVRWAALFLLRNWPGWQQYYLNFWTSIGPLTGHPLQQRRKKVGYP